MTKLSGIASISHDIPESVDALDEFTESSAFGDYTGLLTEIQKLKLEFGKVQMSPRKLYTEDFFHNAELLIRYGAFSKIGKGSSRTAYTFDADPRYILKFAHNTNGLRQNQTGIRNVKSGTYKCLVRVLDYDPSGIFIVEDKCRESTYSDWYRICGISPNMLSKLIRIVFEGTPKNPIHALKDLLSKIRDQHRASQILKKTTALDDEFTLKDHPKIVLCVENMIAVAEGGSNARKWAMLFDLFRFYFEQGLSAMIPEELLYVDQWGVMPDTASGEEALIIIDPGVDDDFRPFVGKDGRVR